MRRVAVVTVGRSDYGILRPVLAAVEAEPALELFLVVAGAHLSAAHGATVSEVEADGFAVGARVPMLGDEDTPLASAQALGRGVAGFAEAFAAAQPDIVLVLGDRVETLAAAVAATPLTIPVAHVHGGETTEGAIDDAIRHATTKLSHLHFAATEEYAARLVAMGEEPWRVTVSGAPALDNLASLDGAAAEPPVPEPFLLVTWHPVTLAGEPVGELLGALGDVDMSVVFTHPNADPGRREIVDAIEAFATSHERAAVVASLGTRAYFGLMRRAAAMVGNSSSGIIEAPSFELPVVNVGDRQRGRVRAANVVDVPPERTAIAAAVRTATSPEFRAGLRGLRNPYGDGHAAARIAAALRDAPPRAALLAKRFHEAQA